MKPKFVIRVGKYYCLVKFCNAGKLLLHRLYFCRRLIILQIYESVGFSVLFNAHVLKCYYSFKHTILLVCYAKQLQLCGI